MSLLAPCFVLIDDARHQGRARLYNQPIKIIEISSVADVSSGLALIREAIRSGLHAAGFISYEAGEAFEPTLGRLGRPTTPLLWFGLFETYVPVDDVAALLPNPAGVLIEAPRPRLSFMQYCDAFEAVMTLIKAGDLYQANLSFRADVSFAGHPHATYAALRTRAGGGYSALVDTGTIIVASLSPELFFDLNARQITCQPMKGTVRRQPDPISDTAAAIALAFDEKQRAENLMIVDLMRNDLSKIAIPGSVKVPSLFSVESYPTVHQLTSTISATLRAERDAVDVLENLFPCGSITGAPKIRAMKALAEIEAGCPRGAYTGAVGYFSPDGSARFNVAIRTLVMRHGESTALLGLGGGIVADSDVQAEWEEALSKGAFVPSPNSVSKPY